MKKTRKTNRANGFGSSFNLGNCVVVLEAVTQIGTEIKQSWWQKNREEYLKGMTDADCD